MVTNVPFIGSATTPSSSGNQNVYQRQTPVFASPRQLKAGKQKMVQPPSQQFKIHNQMPYMSNSMTTVRAQGKRSHESGADSTPKKIKLELTSDISDTDAAIKNDATVGYADASSYVFAANNPSIPIVIKQEIIDSSQVTNPLKHQRNTVMFTPKNRPNNSEAGSTTSTKMQNRLVRLPVVNPPEPRFIDGFNKSSIKEGDGPFKCKLCEKSYSRRQALYVHLGSVHYTKRGEGETKGKPQATKIKKEN